MSTPFENIKLIDGSSIPSPAFGTGTSLFKKSAYDQTLAALKFGIRHIDSAQMYDNEDSVGDAIRDSNISREDIYVVTKYGGGKSVKEEFENSLKKLKLSYLDLYLVHWPAVVNNQEGGLEGVWKAFESLKDEGLVKQIGVSNFDNEDLDNLLKFAKHIPAVNQIELSPTCFRKVEQIYEYNKKLGIVVEAYGSLAAVRSGAEPELTAYLEDLSKKYSISTGGIVLLWLSALGIVSVTTTSKAERFEEYRTVYSSLTLTKDEVDNISNIGKKYLNIIFPERKRNLINDYIISKDNNDRLNKC